MDRHTWLLKIATVLTLDHNLSRLELTLITASGFRGDYNASKCDLSRAVHRNGVALGTVYETDDGRTLSGMSDNDSNQDYTKNGAYYN